MLKNARLKRWYIAARQLHALKEHRSVMLKLHDVKAVFHMLKDQ
jgi:hypothetical protein